MSCCTIVLACLFSVYPFPVLPKELHYFFNILPEDSCIRLLHYAQFSVFTLIYLMPSSVVISRNLLRFKDISRIENSNIFWCICPITKFYHTKDWTYFQPAVVFWSKNKDLIYLTDEYCFESLIKIKKAMKSFMLSSEQIEIRIHHLPIKTIFSCYNNMFTTFEANPMSSREMNIIKSVLEGVR